MADSQQNQTLDSAGNPNPNGPLAQAMALAIPVGYGALTALLVALGIQGDIFTRLLRNQPEVMAVAFLLTIVGAALPVIGRATKGIASAVNRRGKRHISAHGTQVLSRSLDILGGFLVVVGVSIALFSGISSFAAREQPTLKLSSASRASDGTVTLTFDSTALSLQTRDTLGLRIVAIPSVTPTDWVDRACSTPDPQISVDPTPLPTPTTNAISTAGLPPFPMSIPTVLVHNPGAVLFVGDSGPTATGTAANAVTVRVTPDGDPDHPYKYVCALAYLSDTKEIADPQQRFVWLLIDLTTVPSAAAAK